MKVQFSFPKYYCLILILIALFFFSFTKLKAQQTLIKVNGWNAYVHVPWNYSANPSKTYQTIIFFPGIDEVGSDASLAIKYGPGAYIAQGWNGNVKAGSDSVEFIVISLQPPYAFPFEYYINQCIQTLKGMYRIDEKRLHLTGLSMGGWCSTTFVTGDAYGGPYTYASQVATVVEVEGIRPDDNSPYPNLFDNFAIAGGRLLGFEQIYDSRDVETRVNRMNNTKANSGIFISTSYGGGGHCCWEQFYGGNNVEPNKFTLDGTSQDIYQWMAVNPSPEGQSNKSPVAKAGNDISITLPTNSVILNGSGTDADGTIDSYLWSEVSGPNIAGISKPTEPQSSLVKLIAGTYVFQLKVIDNDGATSTDNINVTVNAGSTDGTNEPPVVNAGTDLIIILPVNSVSLSANATDDDGTIASYLWSQVSGPNVAGISNPIQPQTSMVRLIEGTYIFQLEVTDNNGSATSDEVKVTVKQDDGQTSPVGSTKYIMVNIFGGSDSYNNIAWNNWNIGTGTGSGIISGTLKYSDGSASAISSVLSYSNATGDNEDYYGGGMAPEEVLRYTSYSQQDRTLTISGLSTSVKYNIELYASRWSSGNSTIFTVNGTSITIMTFKNLTSKAAFTSITPNSQGQIVVNMQSATDYNYLNGFMITQLATDAGRPENITQANSSSIDVTGNRKIDYKTANEKNLLSNDVTSVKVFPNPVHDEVTMLINNPLSANMKIQIVNAVGVIKKQLELTHILPVSNINIPVNELPDGIYIIKIQLGTWSASKKMMKL